MRPHLEHCAQAGALQYKTATEVLHGAQRWATVLVKAGAQGVRAEAPRAGLDQAGEGKAEGREPLLLPAAACWEGVEETGPAWCTVIAQEAVAQVVTWEISIGY